VTISEFVAPVSDVAEVSLVAVVPEATSTFTASACGASGAGVESVTTVWVSLARVSSAAKALGVIYDDTGKTPSKRSMLQRTTYDTRCVFFIERRKNTKKTRKKMVYPSFLLCLCEFA
jgi:uncharacterized BrkB/YihY/UPF0761 family membrane protein